MNVVDELYQLIKFQQMEIKSAYDNYYHYDKVILVEDLIEILDKLKEEVK